jgi:Concanavalin A-like lectin/glucanases superfamily
MPLQIETQPFQFNSTVTGLSSAVFNSVSASGGNSNQWNSAYQSVATVPYNYSGSNNITPKISGNTVSGNYSVVAGGVSNTLTGNCSNVGGGASNTVTGDVSTVAGGLNNKAIGTGAIVGGGAGNCACANCVTIVGGNNNYACGGFSFIGGGFYNTASGSYANIAGGRGNSVTGCYSTVVGGFYNTASGSCANVAGGISNCVVGSASNVAGGNNNTISSYANSSGILNGNTNSIIGSLGNTAWWSGIGSGCENVIKGQSSFIGAGAGNTNSGYTSIIGAGQANNIITPVSNITSYWNLDEASGNRADNISNNYLYQHNTVSSTPGLINNGIVGNGSGWLETTTSFDFSGDFSVNYWTIPTSNGSQQQFSGTDHVGFNFNVTNSYIYYGIPNVKTFATYFPPGGISTSNWSMATLVRYRNYISMYLNGVRVAGPNYHNGNYSSVIALLALPGGAYVGDSNGTKMDEVGIWKRALNPAEVFNLYNNGRGFTYPFNTSGLHSSSIQSGNYNYIGSNCSFIAAGSNNNIPPGSDNTFILGSNIQALSANFTYVNSLELANTPSVLILKDTTGKRWKIGVDTSGSPVGLGAA